MLQLAHRQRGEGPPLVLLHGLFGASATLNGIARALADDFSVYSFDLPGHGKTPACDDMSFPHLARCLMHSMHSLGIERAQLVGHSLGGKVAMQLALQDASMVDKLCVLDIAPVRYEGGLEVIFETMIATDASAFESREAVDAHIAQRILEPGVRAFLLTNLERNEQRKLQWRINFAELYSHYQDFLSAPAMGQPFEGETLFIKGENSDYILPAHREAVLCSFPKAELKQVAGTGHWLHAEKPEIVHGLIKRFVCRD